MALQAATTAAKARRLEMALTWLKQRIAALLRTWREANRKQRGSRRWPTPTPRTSAFGASQANPVDSNNPTAVTLREAEAGTPSPAAVLLAAVTGLARLGLALLRRHLSTHRA